MISKLLPRFVVQHKLKATIHRIGWSANILLSTPDGRRSDVRMRCRPGSKIGGTSKGRKPSVFTLEAFEACIAGVRDVLPADAGTNRQGGGVGVGIDLLVISPSVVGKHLSRQPLRGTIGCAATALAVMIVERTSTCRRRTRLSRSRIVLAAAPNPSNFRPHAAGSGCSRQINKARVLDFFFECYALDVVPVIRMRLEINRGVLSLCFSSPIPGRRGCLLW